MKVTHSRLLDLRIDQRERSVQLPVYLTEFRSDRFGPAPLLHLFVLFHRHRYVSRLSVTLLRYNTGLSLNDQDKLQNT